MKKRILHRYEIPEPGRPLPGEPTEPPADWDAENLGEWQPLCYAGPDPWDGQEPLFRSFCVVGLTGDEELNAIRAAKGNAHLLSPMCAQASLAEVDDRPVDKGAFEERTLWKQSPPMVRDLWMDAYTAHNVVREVTAETFRASYSRKTPPG